MHELNIGETIARERRAAGITQGELATHLGVTKAAVSKWELDQSLPDVTLLPRIAAYFGITLDELCAYHPQLTTEEVQEVYLELLELFAVDVDAAYERLARTVADYYSCWPLLVQAASLYMWRTAAEPDRTDELRERAGELLRRVEKLSDDLEAVMGAKLLRSSLLSMTAEYEEAIALLESLRPKQPFSADDILAGLYQMQGDTESCLRVHQESLFWGSTSAFNGISSQLPLVEDADHIRALLRAGEGMLEGFALAEENPMAALMYWGNAATACLRIGECERAAFYLERFVDSLEKLDVVAAVTTRPSVLYDRLPQVSQPNPDTCRAAQVQFGAVDMKTSLRDYALANGAWDGVRSDARFAPFLDRLAAL